MILKQMLGKIMTDMGFVNQRQLEEALLRQRKIFEEKIVPERMQRASLVSEARIVPKKTPSLGQVLIDMEFATEDQIKEALREQKKTVQVYRLLDSEKLGTAIEIGSIVNSTLNLAELLAVIMGHVNRVTNSTASTLMLRDDTTGELVFSVPTGPKEDTLTDIRIPSGKGIAGWVAEHEQPALVPDVRKDTRFYSEIDRISGFETKSIICVPLKAKAKLIGVLEAINKVDGSAFTEEDALLLSIFANQAAIAIENARLYGELKESEEKYRRLVEHANDAIFIVQDEVVKFPNPKTEAMIGYSTEELANIPFTNFIHPEDRGLVLERHKRRMVGENPPSTYSFRITNRSGEELWVQLNTVLITWEGRPATLNLLRDITQQRRLEAQFESAQRMESLGTLAGGIAHDFNNLLMAMQGNVSLILSDLDPSHPYYERLRNIERGIRSGAELTNGLLGFARSGKYQVKPTDLNDLIKRSSDMFSRTKKEITIHTKYQRDIWPVEVDRGQIEQALLNLYVNAWQAMPKGGELYLQSENVTFDEDHGKPYGLKPGNYVKMTIADTGLGMGDTTQKRIFEPFFTTKEMGRGTGLGLASVYGIIKNHDGIINVDSKKGEGSTFTFYLPASEKEVVKEEEIPEEVLEGTEMVLLVDDEEMVLDVGEGFLKKLGYTALVARSGKEAIELYKENKDKIDMVILDMIMPQMGGGETYDRLKKINPNIKILLSSGYSINGQAKEIMKRGCEGFIQKPFDMGELSQKIREVLDNE